MNQPEKRSDIFISHISEESVIAKTLKAFLQRIFSNDIDIFVSSDYSSVSGGDFWFTHIIEQLRLSQVVLVLISKDSAHREWINFEAGIGIGTDAKVIPVVIRHFEKSS